MKPKNEYDSFDVEKQLPGFRELEGQDTITSMTNQPFLKQISRLKSASNSKSSLNSAPYSNKLPRKLSNESEYKFSYSSKRSGKKTANLFSIFKVPSQRSLATESITEMLLEDQKKRQFESNGSYAELSCSKRDGMNTPTTDRKLNSNQFLNHFNSMQSSIDLENKRDSKREAKNRNKTDEVFDALNTILHNSNQTLLMEDEFVSALRVIVKENELNQQRKKNKVAWLCTIVTYSFFFFMIVMVVYFVMSIYSISYNLMDHIEGNKVVRFNETLSFEN